MELINSKNIARQERLVTYYEVGDLGLGLSSELSLFLDSFFGMKRLLVLKVNNKERRLRSQLKDYCNENQLSLSELDASRLSPDSIKGELKFIDENGKLYYERSKPEYVTGKNQMIIVSNLKEDTDIEVVRAFCYMGFIDIYNNDRENLPKEKLPDGSGYVFIANDDFPFEKFASISEYWKNESATLDLRDFHTKIKEHLTIYKSNSLGIKEKGAYSFRGNEMYYGYILPKEKEHLNIIEKYRSDFFKSAYLPKTFHQYFHHLNSSQAMCINFFYPLTKEKLLELVIDILGIEGDISYNVVNCCFEKESALEKNSTRKTNFDFFLKLNAGVVDSEINIYFEIKYSENDFGKAYPDSEHKKKFQETYVPLLINNVAINNYYKEEETFLKNYQIMRNLAHIDKNNYIVFLYPQGNKMIRKAAIKARDEIVEKGWKNHFIPFTWEDMIKELCDRLTSEEVVKYFNIDFSDKYIRY